MQNEPGTREYEGVVSQGFSKEAWMSDGDDGRLVSHEPSTWSQTVLAFVALLLSLSTPTLLLLVPGPCAFSAGLLWILTCLDSHNRGHQHHPHHSRCVPRRATAVAPSVMYPVSCTIFPARTASRHPPSCSWKDILDVAMVNCCELRIYCVFKGILSQF